MTIRSPVQWVWARQSLLIFMFSTSFLFAYPHPFHYTIFFSPFSPDKGKKIVCLNWVLYSIEDEPYTYIDFRVWVYVTKKKILPPFTIPPRLKKEFLLTIATLSTLKKMAIPFPEIREEEQELFMKNKPPDMETSLIITWLKYERWIRSFRDNQFQLTLQIHLDEIQKEYETLYPGPDRPPLFKVYEELRKKLVHKKLNRAFRKWQNELLTEISWKEHPVPNQCGIPRNEQSP